MSAPYPREWFSVTSYGSTPRAQLMKRETALCLFYDHTVFGRPEERRVKKTGAYETWYPTLEKAQAVLDHRTAMKRKAAHDAKLAGLAPQLLTALEETLDAVGALTNPTEFPNVLNIPMERGEEILALIKQAKGEPTGQ